ncbi:MAG: DUF7873 family protein [Promethearchaeota archaeon]
MKQNQVIAIVKGKKSQAEKVTKKTYQQLEKNDLFSGIDRTYRPKSEEGDKRPPEKKIVQQTVQSSIADIKEVNEDMINLVAAMDIGNCDAKGNVIVNDITLLKDVPATHLIFLEKRVEDFITLISKLPVLDAAEEWTWNPNIGCYSAAPRETSSTNKVLNHKIVAEVTKEHPAQVAQYTIDEIVGYWSTILLSGNISADDKKNLLKKARDLSDAIKIAREEANNAEIKTSDFGTKIMNYLFGE